jgi:hypothetical protein
MASYILKIATILIAAMIVGGSICAQQKTPFNGWDLTYKSVLERNNVAKTDWVWLWLGHYKSPAEKWISTWDGKPIISSVLIEYPAFHAAEYQTLWFIRTEDEAFYWESTEGRENDENQDVITPELYDALYKHASSWQQLAPKTAKELPEQALPGYFGVLSLSGPNGSKQMLLTVEDFFICLNKACLPGETNMKVGRLMQALEPILIPESTKTYKHKSEAEIAQMTPEQRIDELLAEEENHSFAPDDHQSSLIARYSKMDGLKGLPYIIRLIDGYNPKRSRDTRFFQAMMMANGIDEGTVRLRSSPDGQSVIAAIERLSARMRAEGKTDPTVEMTLTSMKGVNSVDDHIQDTLWVKYRIKVLESDMLAFSDFLVKRDPGYPSWSEQELIKDYSRINKAGSPAQVFIMKKPERFYQEYLTFKKLAKRM